MELHSWVDTYQIVLQYVRCRLTRRRTGLLLHELNEILGRGTSSKALLMGARRLLPAHMGQRVHSVEDTPAFPTDALVAIVQSKSHCSRGQRTDS